MRPLAWEPPCAADEALKRQKKKKKKRKKRKEGEMLGGKKEADSSPCAIGLNCVPSRNSYAEALTPDVVVFGDYLYKEVIKGI